jgi:hypothetical protein
MKLKESGLLLQFKKKVSDRHSICYRFALIFVETFSDIEQTMYCDAKDKDCVVKG